MRLTVHRGERAGSDPGKTALCLCGGGLIGALFEVGVLAGFDDESGRAAANEFDIYVGSSAGASIASLVSQGVSAERAFAALRDPDHPSFSLRRQDARPGQWLKSAAQVLLDAALILVTHFPGRSPPLVDRLARLGRTLPSVADVARELYVVANDVDSAERAGRVDHLDVAIAHGARRILVVNSVAPLRADHGLHVGIERSLAEHPSVEVLLIEPDGDDGVLFTSGSMSLSARAAILDYARSATRRALRSVQRLTPAWT